MNNAATRTSGRGSLPRGLADAVTARRVTRFHTVSTNVATVSARRLHVPPGRIDVIPADDPEELGEREVARRSRIRGVVGCR